MKPQAGNRDIAPLISMEQAIRESGLTRHMLNNLIALGELSALRLPTGRCLVRRSDLEELHRPAANREERHYA